MRGTTGGRKNCCLRRVLVWEKVGELGEGKGQTEGVICRLQVAGCRLPVTGYMSNNNHHHHHLHRRTHNKLEGI